ncbi:MAG: putative lipid II flippase FtsW [Actinobacteria bacterium]|nr:putative lipid II flippase FtsW [Actinomycetota bacterium]
MTGPSRRRRSTQRAGAVLDRPMTSLHLVLVTGALLLLIGLVMVASASMVDSYLTLGSTYGVFKKQLMWVAIGVPVFWLGVRLPPRAYHAVAYPALLASVVALTVVLVPGLGVLVGGSRRWIDLGPVQIQPSEPAKLAFVLWGAALLVRKERMLGEWRHLLVPLVPVVAVLCGLVMLEPDLGTTLCFVVGLFGLLWTVGAPLRLFGTMGAGAVLAVLLLIVVSPYRADRLTGFLDPFAHASDEGYQAVQGLYSLASGGWFGVGLGQSRQKWGPLPNAHTDYIFAILGEELGLVGCLIVLALFATLAYTGMRIARRSVDPFCQLVAGASTVWLSGQAVINMGYVTGLLPVTGIPLPLISFGGTSLVVTLFVLGMLASFARHEPAAIAHLTARRASRTARWLGLPAPSPYVPRAPSPPPLRSPRPRPAPRQPGRAAGPPRQARSAGATVPVRSGPRPVRSVGPTAPNAPGGSGRLAPTGTYGTNRKARRP